MVFRTCFVNKRVVQSRSSFYPSHVLESEEGGGAGTRMLYPVRNQGRLIPSSSLPRDRLKVTGI